MEKTSGALDLISIVAGTESIAKKLREAPPILFSHVIESAHAFLIATIAQQVRRTLWVICPRVNTQENIYESLLNWRPDALFLPEAEFAAVENILPDPEIAAERLALLTRIERESGPHLIVATAAGLDQPAPTRGAIASAMLQLKRRQSVAMEVIINSLGAAHYERVAQVTTRGQFAVRGGILDIYSWQSQLPVRVEFFGDDIESLREFDIDTQTSLRNLPAVDILLGAAEDQRGRVRDYVNKDDWCVAIEPEENDEAEIKISEGWIEAGPEDFAGAFQDCEVGEFSVGDFMLAEAKRTQFSTRLKEWREGGARTVIYFQTEGEIERFREIIGEADLEGVDLLVRHACPRLLFSGRQPRRPFCGGIVWPVPDAWASTFAAGRASRAQPRANRFQRTERRRFRGSSRTWRRPFSRVAENWPGAISAQPTGAICLRLRQRCVPPKKRSKKFSRLSSPMTRNSTSHSSRPIWFRDTSGSGKNRRHFPRSRMQNGRAQNRRRPLRFSITRERCSRFRLSARRSRATLSAPTQNGRPNSSIHFRFAKRPTN